MIKLDQLMNFVNVDLLKNLSALCRTRCNAGADLIIQMYTFVFVFLNFVRLRSNFILQFRYLKNYRQTSFQNWFYKFVFILHETLSRFLPKIGQVAIFKTWKWFLSSKHRSRSKQMKRSVLVNYCDNGQLSTIFFNSYTVNFSSW